MGDIVFHLQGLGATCLLALALLFSGSLLVIFFSSLEDCFIDLLWLSARLAGVKEAQLSDEAVEESLLAVLVPAWQEAEVLPQSLAHLLTGARYRNFRVFVGVYPNDPATEAAARQVARQDGRVIPIVTPRPGPTCKADCLNALLQGALSWEEGQGSAFAGFILQDAEDMAHPEALSCFNRALRHHDLVQLPVVPLVKRWSACVGGHYMDEFAEMHGKEVPVRALATGIVPGSGVATAYARHVVLEASKSRGGAFNTGTLTEDYELSFRLSDLALRQTFLRLTDSSGPALGTRRDLIATREIFPHRLRDAVKQKARWIVGISFQGWKQLGWQGSLLTRYFFLRDRKIIFCGHAALFSWLGLLYSLGQQAAAELLPAFAPPPLLAEGDLLWQIAMINLAFLLYRLLVRHLCVWSLYGWRPLAPARASHTALPGGDVGQLPGPLPCDGDVLFPFADRQADRLGQDQPCLPGRHHVPPHGLRAPACAGRCGMKSGSAARTALWIALLLFALLSVGLGFAATKRAQIETVALHRLTPQGMYVENMEVLDAATAYEQLLLTETAPSWLQASRERLKRHGALRRSQVSAREGDLAAARHHLAAYLARYPSDQTVRWRLLEVAAAQGDHKAVSEAAAELLSRNPGFGPALLRRAQARHMTDDGLGAVHDFMRALERPLATEDFAAAAAGLLQLLVDRGEAGAARRYARQLRQGIALPQSALLLAFAAHALEEHEVAADHFREALQATPSPEITLALARSLSLSGQDGEALRLLLGSRFRGRPEQERWSLLSRLAGRVGLDALAMEAADEALAAGNDPDLRLELAQRLLDRRPGSREASERAWLLLADDAQRPCTNGLADARRCRQLAAEALRRLGRQEDLVALLRSSLAGSADRELLAQLAMALLETEASEGALLLASLGSLEQNPEQGDPRRRQAAEAFLGAGAADLSLLVLDRTNAQEVSLPARELEIYAAQQAGDWQRLKRLLEAQPAAADGLPEKDGQAGAFCDALAALESPALRRCLERLAGRHPSDAALRYRIAASARDAGDSEAAVIWLRDATRVRADPRWLLELGFLLTHLKQPLEAESAFRAAGAAGAGAEAEIALAYSLAGRGRKGAAAHHLRSALAQEELSDRQRGPALELLAQLLEEAGAAARAAEYLREALRLEEDDERRLRLARAEYAAGLTAAAEANLRRIDRSALDVDASLLWFDLAADLAGEGGKDEAAVQLRQAAAAIGPTAARHELLASALLQRDGSGDREAARAQLAIAIALSEQPSAALLARLAYLDQEAGGTARAELLLREAMQQAPDVQEYREDLAQLLAGQGQREEAVPLLRAALEAAAEHPHADRKYRRDRVAQLQAQHVAATRRWRAQWYETFCIGGDNDCVRPSLTSAGNSVGQGHAEIGFVPFLSRRFGLVELTARLNWDRAPGQFAPRGRYLQGALGFRYKPFQNHDLWFGSERLQAIGPDGRNDWRIFASYGWSRGRDWATESHGLRPFLSFYGELNRNLGGDQERSAASDIQLGFRGQRGETFAYLPFAYLSSGREQTRDLAFYRYEAGLGITTDWRFNRNLYDGYLTTASLSFRVGHERDTRGQGATRGILSLGLRY